MLWVWNVLEPGKLILLVRSTDIFSCMASLSSCEERRTSNTGKPVCPIHDLITKREGQAYFEVRLRGESRVFLWTGEIEDNFFRLPGKDRLFLPSALISRCFGMKFIFPSPSICLRMACRPLPTQENSSRSIDFSWKVFSVQGRRLRPSVVTMR